MKRRFKMYLGMLLLVAMIAVSVGCQAVGGIDVSKALLNSVDVKTMEGSGYVTLEFTPAAAGGPDAEAMKAMSPMKIVFDHMKQESRDTASLQGSLELPKGKIPFAMSITPKEMAIQVEGAAKPFVVKLDELSGMDADTAEMMGLPAAELESMQQKLQDPAVVKPLYSYMINGMPNPKNISVVPTTETINGKSVSLMKVKTELDGQELIPWAKSYVLRLMQDDTGMKSAIGPIYDAMKPLLGVMAQELNGQEDSMAYSGMLESALGSIIGMMNEDKDVAVEIVHTEAKQLMVVMLGLLDQAQKQGGDYLNDKSSFKAELYVDGSLNIRKTRMELAIAMPEAMAADSGMAAMKVTSEFSTWNEGGAVKADLMDTTQAVDVTALSDQEMLQQFDSKSTAYRMLKEDLHVGRRSAYFFIPPQGEELDWGFTPGAYFEDGTAMVRARDLADQLELGLEWQPADQSVTLTSVSGASVTLRTGSTDAVANGEAAEASIAPVIKDGSLFVPLRFVTEALGAVVEYDAEANFVIVQLD